MRHIESGMFVEYGNGRRPKQAIDLARVRILWRALLAAGWLSSKLLSQPVVKHGPREADVSTDPMARQAAGSHGLIDPARLDIEIPSRLLRAKEPILRQGGRRLRCCWYLHTPYRPPSARSGQEICSYSTVACSTPSIRPKRRPNY